MNRWDRLDKWSACTYITTSPDRIWMDVNLDLLHTARMHNRKSTNESERNEKSMGTCGLFNSLMPKIKKVIYNPPATIILWDDGTKSVAKTQNGEFYDAEKGLAMAFMRKFLNNKNYHKYLEEAQEYEAQFIDS